MAPSTMRSLWWKKATKTSVTSMTCEAVSRVTLGTVARLDGTFPSQCWWREAWSHLSSVRYPKVCSCTGVCDGLTGKAPYCWVLQSILGPYHTYHLLFPIMLSCGRLLQAELCARSQPARVSREPVWSVCGRQCRTEQVWEGKRQIRWIRRSLQVVERWQTVPTVISNELKHEPF